MRQRSAKKNLDTVSMGTIECHSHELLKILDQFHYVKDRAREEIEMRRLWLDGAKPAIGLVILIVATVLPVYSQEMTSKIDAGQVTGSRSALSAGETPTVPDGQSTGSRSALIAGETPAVPGNQSATRNIVANPDTVADEGTGTLETSTTSPTPTSSQTPSASPTPTTSSTASTPYVFPTGDERRKRYVKSTVGPFSLLRIAFSAGINQWRDSPEEWEQGMSGYGKRLASGFGRNTIQQTVIYGLDSAMGLDTGFKRSTRTGFFPRMKDALAENITSRNREGKRVISVPRIAGVYSSRIIAYETWYPNTYDYKDALLSGTRSLITGFGMNLIREFVVKF